MSLGLQKVYWFLEKSNFIFIKYGRDQEKKSKTSKSSKHHWNILKRACGMDEAKSKTNIELKDSNGIIISEPMEVANFFNEYFSTIGMTTVSKIPQCDIDFKAYLPNSKNSFVFF